MEKREWEWEAAGMKTEKTAACEKSRPVPAEELAGIMSLAWSFTLSHMLSSMGPQSFSHGTGAYMLSRLGTSATETGTCMQGGSRFRGSPRTKPAALITYIGTTQLVGAISVEYQKTRAMISMP